MNSGIHQNVISTNFNITDFEAKYNLHSVFNLFMPNTTLFVLIQNLILLFHTNSLINNKMVAPFFYQVSFSFNFWQTQDFGTILSS